MARLHDAQADFAQEFVAFSRTVSDDLIALRRTDNEHKHAIADLEAKFWTLLWITVGLGVAVIALLVAYILEVIASA